jgi:hypothetical protein
MKDLDELLRQDAADGMDDGGFTLRVLSALPPRRANGRAWLRPVLVMGSAVVGSLLAMVLSPQLESPVAAITSWLASGQLSAGGIATLAIGFTLLLSAVVFAASEA